MSLDPTGGRPSERPFAQGRSRETNDLLDHLTLQMVDDFTLAELEELGRMARADMEDPYSPIPAHRSAIRARLVADATRIRLLIDDGVLEEL